jgi:hypothetical protein
MLVIRDEQMSAFASASLPSRLKAHVEKFLPHHCRALGPEGTEAAIAYGLERARRYALTSDADVYQYIDLMFAFGRDFDDDPALPWAREILNAPDDPRAEPKIDRLYHAAMDYLREARAR